MNNTETPGKVGRPPKVRQGGRQLRRTTILLPDGLLRDLDRAADDSGLDSRAAVIRAACLAFLKQHGSAPAGVTS